MISDREYKRICWASRRGMLELDLLLVPFVKQKFARLSAADQQAYIRLLEGEDNDLFAWLLGHKQPDDPQLAAMVQQIVNFNRTEKHNN